MTIDERLDRLTESHEALTQTVEIIASMEKENERQLNELGAFIRAFAELVRSDENRLNRLEG